MVRTTDISGFFQAKKTLPVLDVRSPGEYTRGHIPGAVSLPLFSDEERKEVGTLYKEEGRETAFLNGLDLVGPKMSGFVKDAESLVPGKEMLLHCWRGGMRSESMAWLLGQAGFQVCLLKGGYKAYRRQVHADLSLPLKLVILGGRTGSGKTEVLRKLTDLGEQVIDLEGLANHKGSAFGSLGQAPQPTVEQFENELHACLSRLDSAKPIWIEDESAAIGKVHLPKPFWEKMKQAPVIDIDVPLEARVSRLVEEYASFPDEQLAEAIRRIQRRLGDQNARAAIEALAVNDYARTARICLGYYDKSYANCLDRREEGQVYRVEVREDQPELTAQKVREVLSKEIWKK